MWEVTFITIFIGMLFLSKEVVVIHLFVNIILSLVISYVFYKAYKYCTNSNMGKLFLYLPHLKSYNIKTDHKYTSRQSFDYLVLVGVCQMIWQCFPEVNHHRWIIRQLFWCWRQIIETLKLAGYPCTHLYRFFFIHFKYNCELI